VEIALVDGGRKGLLATEDPFNISADRLGVAVDDVGEGAAGLALAKRESPGIRGVSGSKRLARRVGERMLRIRGDRDAARRGRETKRKRDRGESGSPGSGHRGVLARARATSRVTA